MDPVAVDQAAVDVAFLDRAAVDLDAHARSGAPRMEELILATRMELSALPEKLAFVLGGNPLLVPVSRPVPPHRY